MVEEAIQMGTTAVPAAILAGILDLETILHPTPTGMNALGLDMKFHGFLLPVVRITA